MKTTKYTTQKSLKQVRYAIASLIDKKHQKGIRISKGMCIGEINDFDCKLIGSGQIYHGMFGILPAAMSDADVEVNIEMKYSEYLGKTEIESKIHTPNLFNTAQIAIVSLVFGSVIYFICENAWISAAALLIPISFNQLSKSANAKREQFWQEYIKNYIEI